MKSDLLKRIKNPYFWVWPLLVLSGIFGILHIIFNENWLYVATFIPWIPLILLLGVNLIFAWIVNPIRMIIKKRKEKTE